MCVQRRYEDDLEAQRRENTKLSGKMKAMSEELMKGNEIIKKLQAEIKNYHGKVGAEKLPWKGGD